MRMRVALAAVLAMLLPLSGLSAQPSDEPAAGKPGSLFGFLSGVWRGAAWVQVGDQRYSFEQVERVAPHLDDSILLLDGRGVDAANPERQLFGAFAVISANPETGGFEMRSYSGGRVGTFPAALAGPNAMTWQYRSADGITRYTHRIEGDRWIGTGEISRDGKSWTQTLGMDLKRERDVAFVPWAGR